MFNLYFAWISLTVAMIAGFLSDAPVAAVALASMGLLALILGVVDLHKEKQRQLEKNAAKLEELDQGQKMLATLLMTKAIHDDPEAAKAMLEAFKMEVECPGAILTELLERLA